MASCTYTVGDKNASGDNYYAPFVTEDQRHYFWNTYGFKGNSSYWDEGWGWDDHANTDKALARTYNACWVLTYSAIDWPNDGYGTNNILNWARRYIRNTLDEVEPQCSSNPYVIARTYTGAFVDDRTELYPKFFYECTVIERAAVLLHETRHYDKGHDADFPSWSSLGNKPEGKGQADSKWGAGGAYEYEVAYLSWYHNVAPAATPAMRARARQRANWCLDNAFAQHPGFSIGESAAPQSGWRWCRKCNALAFAGFGVIGRCAAGGAHDHGGSWNLPLVHGTYAPAQNGWKYCNKCHMLTYSKHASQGPCPAGGKHEQSGSWDFAMLPGVDHAGTQRGWKWCDKCEGMVYSPFGGSHCPAGGAHHMPSGDYALPALPDDVYPSSQSEWRWCSKCQGLHYAPNGGGVCPAGGKHNAASWNYTMFYDAPSAGQTGWKWCKKCQGMAYGGGAPGACPAGGKHDHTGSGAYVMPHDAPNMGQEGWRWCSKCQGLHYGLNGPGVCPAGGGHNHASWAYGLAYTP